MPLFFFLLTIDHFQRGFLNKLFILSTLSNILLPFKRNPFDKKSAMNHKQLFDVNQNLLARALKNIFSAFSVCFPLSTSNNQEISCFHESNCTYLCYFYDMGFIQP